MKMSPEIIDSTSLSYWLHWSVLICAFWVLIPLVIAIYLIWKYENSDHSKSEKIKNQYDKTHDLCDEDAWRPSLKEIHPVWLLTFRIVTFFVLLGTLVADVSFHGVEILDYYTQWTFALVTIYFGLGSVLSFYGFRQHNKYDTPYHVKNGDTDTEKGLFVPLTCDGNVYRVELEKTLNHQDKSGGGSSPVSTLVHVFQVVFQMSAGAVMLTDCVYWLVIYPFLTVNDEQPDILTILTHVINAVALLGDTALNCLPFPWFRISYFLLWTGIYVIVQWIVHACIPLWWPYPFLDLAAESAPVWYLLVALLHIPCYGICGLLVDLKHYLLSKWSPLSYDSLI